MKNTQTKEMTREERKARLEVALAKVQLKQGCIKEGSSIIEDNSVIYWHLQSKMAYAGKVE